MIRYVFECILSFMSIAAVYYFFINCLVHVVYIFSPPIHVHVHVAAVIIVITQGYNYFWKFCELKHNTSSNKFIKSALYLYPMSTL